MSFQVLPQAQPQQPVQVYPTTTVSNQQPPSHHYSNGSFGTVFIVLAVILVISLIACFLGRLCSRRGRSDSHGGGGGGHGHKPFKQQNMNHNQNQNHHFRPKEGGDIELGLDKRIPTTKSNGPGLGHGPGYGGQGSRPMVYGGGANSGVSRGEEKGFEMKNLGEGSMREQGPGPRHGQGYGGRGPRPILYGAGRGNGGEEKGYEMKNGGERSMREQGYNGHDAPYKFTL
ncbi:hypothetical protein K1719_003592 [Acacia pycnantha]|nr:hypothetical protein K1719_003592 [Acacia pycnantha]